MGIKSALTSIYDKQYKKLVMLTVLMLAIAIGILGYQYATTGQFVEKGVSLKGGITLTIPTEEDHDVHSLQQQISKELPKADIGIRSLTEAGRTRAIVIETADAEPEELENAVKKQGIKLEKDKYTIESMGSTLGKQFFKQTIAAITIAFIAMGLVVFLTFRKIVPSLFIILSASSDMICTLAVVSILGVKLSTAGVAAFLMLIGYTADTNILLTTRVVRRREGTVSQRTIDAMKTGLTMTLAVFIAAIVCYIFTTSDMIKQIMLILVIGLAFDMLNTWIQNTGILRWYMERKTKETK